VTRATAIKALKTMCISKVRIISLDSILAAVGSHLSAYLSQNSRAFRQQCLDALVHLVNKYGTAIPRDTTMQILTDIVPFITDTDLYITDLCVQVAVQVLDSAPAVAPAVVEKCVPAVLTVCRSPLLQGSALDSILSFLSRIARHREHCPFERLRQQLSDTSVVASAQAQAQRHVIGTLAKGLAAVVSSSAQDVQAAAVQHFLGTIQQCAPSPAPEAVQQVELSLLALGETGKYTDLSSTPGFCDTLLKQLESSSDEIRLAAALALGFATVGAMGTLLKVVIDNVQQAGSAAKGQKTQYLLLTSLREVIAIGVGTQRQRRRLAVMGQRLPTQSGLAARIYCFSSDALASLPLRSVQGQFRPHAAEAASAWVPTGIASLPCVLATGYCARAQSTCAPMSAADHQHCLVPLSSFAQPLPISVDMLLCERRAPAIACASLARSLQGRSFVRGCIWLAIYVVTRWKRIRFVRAEQNTLAGMALRQEFYARSRMALQGLFGPQLPR
ncbi:unnamed protein product, partial [Prorocentrum cordatum]